MNLLICADASPEIGVGHVMRCLALAQAWQAAGGQAILATAGLSQPLQQRLEQNDIRVIQAGIRDDQDAARMVETAQAVQADWVVLDGYQFDADDQRQIKAAGFRLLALDDYGHVDHYYADLVLNQNLSADSQFYARREPYTRLLLGTDYALLRREFWPWRDWQRVISPVAKHILVTMGGSDPHNTTQQVLQALLQSAHTQCNIRAVAGPNNPYLPALEALTAANPTRIELNRDVTDMPTLLAWADLAIAAGGSTNWELAFMGLPTFTVIVADNQVGAVTALSDAGVTCSLGWRTNLDDANIVARFDALAGDSVRRQEMSLLGRRLVDGKGSDRVVMAMKDPPLRLRRADGDDSRLIWEWANDPQVRELSFSSGQIPWEKHVNWFENKLHDPNTLIFIAYGDAAVGQIRFERVDEGEVKIGISIAREYRGKGYGTLLLKLATDEVFRTTSIHTIHAFVKQENNASIRAFEKAGFDNIGVQEVENDNALHFILKRGS